MNLIYSIVNKPLYTKIVDVLFPSGSFFKHVVNLIYDIPCIPEWFTPFPGFIKQAKYNLLTVALTWISSYLLPGFKSLLGFFLADELPC